MPHVHEFEDGHAIPLLGLGTWKSAPGEVESAVREAIRIGYRHIDCSPIYGNEPEVGDGLRGAFDAGSAVREDLWVTSKLWNDAHAPGDVRPALERTLADLGLEYLDAYLIHWPVVQRPGSGLPQSTDDLLPLEEVPIAETWACLEEAVAAGLVRHLGVSNFSAPKLEALIGAARIRPDILQVELHPYLQQPELVGFAQARGVHVTAYSPLGSRDRPERLKPDDEPILLEDQVIGEIASRHGATPAQVLIAWAIHRGTSVIPKSVHPDRIAENLEAAELSLEGVDLERIAELDRHRRYIDGTFWAREGSPYTVAGLWDE